MTHEELDKMFEEGSAIMMVVRVAEKSMAETYGCVDKSVCTLKELIYMQWTTGNVTNKKPSYYELSKYKWV